MKHCSHRIVYSLVCLGLVLGMTSCAQPTSQETAMISGPMSSEQPVAQGYPELRNTAVDDGRIAALETAAAQHPRAAYDLALRYFRGDGVGRDSYRALTWMRAAAEGGDFNAQKALGRLYLTGLEEMGSDPREARTWLSLAASRGDKESAKLLAEAEAATRSDEEEYKWQNRWRPVVYRWWWSGYSYYGYWNGHMWNY